MKRRKKLTQKKKRKYTCEACGYMSQSLDDYKNHTFVNTDCRKKSPYCCQFCTYVGCDHSQLERHLLMRPICNQYYQEKQVTTGQILDLSLGQLPVNASSPNKNHMSLKAYHFLICKPKHN